MMAAPLRAVADIGGTRTPIAYKFVSPAYFDVFGREGYSLGVNVAVWTLTH